MSFGDLSSNDGLNNLNKYLESRSFIKDFAASQEDLSVLAQINIAAAQGFTHVARWAAHINYLFSTGALKGKLVAPTTTSAPTAAETKKPVEAAPKKDDDFDLFGDDDDDGGAAAALIAKKKQEAEEKKKKDEEEKKKKKVVIAKSTVIIDVKPIGEETDMAALEKQCREIVMDGLLWGGSELIPVAYGIKLLRIIAIIVDDLVSADDLCERIQGFEDCQSTDIFAFNKV